MLFLFLSERERSRVILVVISECDTRYRPVFLPRIYIYIFILLIQRLINLNKTNLFYQREHAFFVFVFLGHLHIYATTMCRINIRKTKTMLGRALCRCNVEYVHGAIVQERAHNLQHS